MPILLVDLTYCKVYIKKFGTMLEILSLLCAMRCFESSPAHILEMRLVLLPKNCAHHDVLRIWSALRMSVVRLPAVLPSRIYKRSYNQGTLFCQSSRIA